jgi:PhoPQ-activated pathogenicity-related protein
VQSRTLISQEKEQMKRFKAMMLTIALAGSVIAAQAQQDTTTTTAAPRPHRKTAAKKAGPTVSEQLG